MVVISEDKNIIAVEVGDFSEAVTASSLVMRKALADFVSAIPGPIRRPRELENTLEIDYRLAWSVFHVMTATNIMGAANHIPNPSAIGRLIERAERKGVPSAVLDSLRLASHEFQRVVLTHARDRASFDAIVAGVSSADGQSQIDIAERRTAYRVNAHIWGSQTEMQAVGFFVRRSATHGKIDECGLTSRLGLQRVRPGAHTIAYRYKQVTAPTAQPIVREVPLDPDAHQKFGACLLPDFCTQPLPRFKREVTTSMVSYEFEDDAVGLRSAVDLSFGSIIRDLPPVVDANGRKLTYYHMTFRTPLARLHLDLIVHRPSFGRIDPELLIIGSMANAIDPPIDVLKSELMPLRAEIALVEGGIDCAHTSQAPRYADMLRYACTALDWNPKEFDIYRTVIEYPILHSTVRVQFPV